jgi:hypothetical protein
MPNGANTVARFAQLALERSEQNIALKIDFKNAFNSLSRARMLEELFERAELKPFYALAHWTYNRPSTLLVRGKGGELIEWLPSAQGVRQGCVLGSLLFATATLSVLETAKELSLNAEVFAYLDDVIIAGEPDACMNAFRHVKEGAAFLGLSVRAECEVLVPKSRPHVVRTGLQAATQALPLMDLW